MSELTDRINDLIRDKDYNVWKLKQILDDLDEFYSKELSQELFEPIINFCYQLELIEGKPPVCDIFNYYARIIQEHEKINKAWKFE